MVNEEHGETVAIGRIAVRLPNPGKVYFPGDGITKSELADYYRRAAASILPQVKDRPLVMARFPDGIGGQRIVQKNVPDHFPDWVPRTEVAKHGRLRRASQDDPWAGLARRRRGLEAPGRRLAGLRG